MGASFAPNDLLNPVASGFSPYTTLARGLPSQVIMKLFPSCSSLALALGLVCFVGCGGTQSPPNDSPPDGPAHLHHEGGTEPHDAHEMKVFPSLDEFHDVFAPIWHTENDSERVSNACAKVGAIHAQAQKIEEGPVPEKVTDQDAWKAKAHSLMENADALRKDCDVGREAVLPRLKSLHEGFHALLDHATGKLKQ